MQLCKTNVQVVVLVLTRLSYSLLTLYMVILFFFLVRSAMRQPLQGRYATPRGKLG